MRLFALKDSTDPDGSVLAVLCCYEGTGDYFMDMPPDTDPWVVPFVLSSFANRGRWSIGSEWSRRWVESRLVPRSRQNLGEILRVNGLEGYDTLRLLEMTQGRNSQDDCYLEPLRIDDCPEWFLERERGRVVEAIALDDQRLLVAFRSGATRLLDAEDILSLGKALARVVADANTFERVKVAPGGHAIRWGRAVEVGAAELAVAGTSLPLTWTDLKRIAPTMLIDVAEAAEVLDCTRQNIHALSKRGALPIAKSSGKATLFLRADVNSRMAGSTASTHYTHINF